MLQTYKVVQAYQFGWFGSVVVMASDLW